MALPEQAAHHLSSQARQLLVNHASVHELKNGDTVVEHGQAKPPFLGVFRGIVAVLHGAAFKERVVTEFAIRREGLLMGSSDRSISPYEVRSVGSSIVVTWPIKVLKMLMIESPGAAELFMGYFMKKQLKLHAHHAMMSTLTLEARIAYLFWSVSEPASGRPGRVVTTKISQSLIGSYFGHPRTEVNRKRSVLERSLFIKVEDDAIWLSPDLPRIFGSAPDPWETNHPRSFKATVPAGL
jgi:CRP-like cAMP-binding protein